MNDLTAIITFFLSNLITFNNIICRYSVRDSSKNGLAAVRSYNKLTLWSASENPPCN